MTPAVDLPPTMLALSSRGPTWPAWLDELPRAVTGLLDDWGLVPDGPATHGECALVVPVRDADGRPAALKTTWPHDEARYEHLALQHWHGDGAVELIRAEPHRWSMLLERLEPVDLASLDDVSACEVAGGLYRRLHRPAIPQLDRLSRFAASWAQRLAGLGRDAPAPPRMIAQAAALAGTFAADPATDGVLVHGDLHYANVLAGSRAPWLAIDPKPLSGDPHHEVGPLLWNRWDEVTTSGDVRWAVRRRVDAVVATAGLDPDRTRDWVVVRAMVNVLWAAEAAQREGRGLTAAEREWITRAVAVAKAVQD